MIFTSILYMYLITEFIIYTVYQIGLHTGVLSSILYCRFKSKLQVDTKKKKQKKTKTELTKSLIIPAMLSSLKQKFS